MATDLTIDLTDSPSPALRLATWNVDSIRARMELVGRWIESNQPDVIGLQETKVADRAFPRHRFTDLGYEVAFAGGGGHGGVALASRAGLDDVVVGIPGARAPLAERRSISATVGGLRVHTIYAPNGRKVGTEAHSVKLAWLELFRRWVEMEGLDEGAPTAVIGDLNIAPADIDVWDASRYRKRNLTSRAERESFERLIEAGLVDVIRGCHQGVPIFSWWNRRSDFFETDRGWRLDHILVDRTTADRVVAAWVDRDERARPGSSDHAPVVVDLRAG